MGAAKGERGEVPFRVEVSMAGQLAPSHEPAPQRLGVDSHERSTAQIGQGGGWFGVCAGEDDTAEGGERRPEAQIPERYDAAGAVRGFGLDVLGGVGEQEIDTRHF